jgi:hypothetical protein
MTGTCVCLFLIFLPFSMAEQSQRTIPGLPSSRAFRISAHAIWPEKCNADLSAAHGSHFLSAALRLLLCGQPFDRSKSMKEHLLHLNHFFTLPLRTPVPRRGLCVKKKFFTLLQDHGFLNSSTFIIVSCLGLLVVTPSVLASLRAAKSALAAATALVHLRAWRCAVHRRRRL